ncbi:MAG: hypothetical protein ACIAXF_16960 [Phycisphaerales bacterium JB063]
MVLGLISGGVGLITSLVMAFLVIAEMRDTQLLLGMLGPCVLAFQSVLLITFVLMIRAMSKVILAIFEMSIVETRQKIEAQRGDE